MIHMINGLHLRDMSSPNPFLFYLYVKYTYAP